MFLFLISLFGITQASFVIQKMREESPSRYSNKYLASNRNQNNLNSLVRSSTYHHHHDHHDHDQRRKKASHKNKSRVIYSHPNYSQSTTTSKSKKHFKNQSSKAKNYSTKRRNQDTRSKNYDTRSKNYSSKNHHSTKYNKSHIPAATINRKPNWSNVNILTSIGVSSLRGSSRKAIVKESKSTKLTKSRNLTPTIDQQIQQVQQVQQVQQGQQVQQVQSNFQADDFVYQNLPLNEWTQFYFSEVGQLPYSRWTFDTPANEICDLQVVDSFCAGDQFEASRRLEGGQEQFLLSTPPVPYNPEIAEQIRLGSSENCSPFTTDPEVAWASSDWSKGQVRLQPGNNYQLILKSLLAPYGAGGAFVKINCQAALKSPNTNSPATTQNQALNLCSYNSSPIKYVRQSLTFPQLASVCQSYGLQPLAASLSNIKDARNVLMNCAGVESRAWIASYNGDNYGGVVGLSLHATQMSEMGSISATPDTSAIQGALCQ